MHRSHVGTVLSDSCELESNERLLGGTSVRILDLFDLQLLEILLS